MAGLKGNVDSLNAFAARLREIPKTLAIKVAEESAPEITALAKSTFAAGENAYGVTWAPLKSGERTTLNRSGGLAAGVYYVAIGTKIRVKLAVSYAKYQIGKRPIFPRKFLPTAYVRQLASTAHATIRAQLGGLS
jgi:hypothetical protein